MGYILFEQLENNLRFAIVAILIGSILITVTTWGIFRNSPHLKKIEAGLLGFLLIATIISIMLSAQHWQKQNEISAKDHEIASQNIIKKYNVKEVLWDSSDTEAVPKETKGDKKLIVVTQDNTEYIFKYRVNLETGEPFLKDMPVPGGSNTKDAVTAESLLKNN